MNPKREQGTAIFMALLIIVIVASITVLLLKQLQIDIRRTQMMLTSEEAYLYSQGVLDWAVSTLQTDFNTPSTSTPWPLILPPTTIANGQGKIAGTLQDAEGLFNINNFAKNTPQTPKTPTGGTAGKIVKAEVSDPGSSQKDAMTLTNLMNLLEIPTNQDQVNEMINAITAWTTAANPSQPNAMDGYDDGYTRQNPPYRAPHAPMVSISELRIVAGISPALYNRLSPYLIALPTNTTINTQHAPPLLLKALGETSTAASQGKEPRVSQYFLLRTDVYLRDQHLVVYTLLKRDKSSADAKQPIIRQQWQSFGTM